MIIHDRDISTPTLVIGAIGLVAVPLLFLADPATSSWLPPCPFRAATGWLCPGCGSTRALHALVHGHLGEALRFNPLAVAALPIVSRHLWLECFTSGDMAMARLRPFVIYGLAAGVTAFGVLRNIF